MAMPSPPTPELLARYQRVLRAYRAPDIRHCATTGPELRRYMRQVQFQERRAAFTRYGKKPSKADLPGLDTNGLVCGKYPNGGRIWRFCLDNLLAN